MASPSSSNSSLVFPHPALTLHLVEPTNSTLRLLQKEVHANARQICSPRGGGQNGHLSIMMPDAAYLARTQVAFVAPIHPGAVPVHAIAATGLQMAETIRLFNQNVDEHRLHQRVHAELKQQILMAIPTRYLQILEDLEMGYSDVIPRQMLEHLKATYGIIAADDVENNRNRLSNDWSPDDPIEDLWCRITTCQAFAPPTAPIPCRPVRHCYVAF
jgi:hypothetical protein